MKHNPGNIENTKIYKEIISRKRACYFISPHLDDAIFSSANLLIELVRNSVPVNIINVFSEADSKPYTASAWKFLLQCGYYSADKLFADRRDEDRKVINKLGAQVENLGFTDALWRRLKYGGMRGVLGQYIGELTHVYPTYKFGIARGIVSSLDHKIYPQLQRKLLERIQEGSIVFCPIAIGRHVDHLIVRDVCKSTFRDNIVYWSDYPYETQNSQETEFIESNHLRAYTYMKYSPLKNELINGYLSQMKVIFGGVADHSNVTETYYIQK